MDSFIELKLPCSDIDKKEVFLEICTYSEAEVSFENTVTLGIIIGGKNIEMDGDEHYVTIEKRELPFLINFLQTSLTHLK